jgi:hypothetical protein
MSGRFLLLAVMMSLVFVFSISSVSAYNLQDLINSLRSFVFPSAQPQATTGGSFLSWLFGYSAYTASGSVQSITVYWLDSSCNSKKSWNVYPGSEIPEIPPYSSDSGCYLGNIKIVMAFTNTGSSKGYFIFDLQTHPVSGGTDGSVITDPHDITEASASVAAGAPSTRTHWLQMWGEDVIERCWLKASDSLTGTFQQVFYRDVSIKKASTCDSSQSVSLTFNSNSATKGQPVTATIQSSSACIGKTARVVNKNNNNAIEGYNTLQQSCGAMPCSSCQITFNAPQSDSTYFAFIDLDSDTYRDSNEPISSDVLLKVQSSCSADVSISYVVCNPNTGNCNPCTSDPCNINPGDVLGVTITGTNKGKSITTQDTFFAKFTYGLFELQQDSSGNCLNQKKSTTPVNGIARYFVVKSWNNGASINAPTTPDYIYSSSSDANKCYGTDVFIFTSPFDSTKNPCYLGIGKSDTDGITSDGYKEADNGDIVIKYVENGATPKIKFGAATTTTTTVPGPTTTTSPPGPTTTTQPGPTTTTQPGSTTTTIPTSFSVSCDECFAGSTCYCNISAPCDDGTWNIVNKEGTPLQYSIIQSIPPIKVSFAPNTTGTIQASATCFKPVYSPSRSIATALVKPPFLICANPCSVNQKCDCVVNGCKDGKFMAILGNIVLKNEAISTEAYAASMYPQTTGSIDVEVTCTNPNHADQASILVSGTGPPTTIGPQGRFTGSMSCISTPSGYRCSLDYSNGYGPAYLVFFLFKSTTGEFIDYSNSIQVPIGSGTKDNIFTCSGRSGNFYVSWTAFTDSSLLNPIPGAWSKPDERRQITC